MEVDGSPFLSSLFPEETVKLPRMDARATRLLELQEAASNLLESKHGNMNGPGHVSFPSCCLFS